MSLGRVYKVVVVEDEPVLLKNTIQKINASEFFEVTGSAKNGKDALDVIDKVKPHVLFTDIRMPKMDGLELIKQVKPMYPDLLIIILSGYNEFEYVQHAIKLGVKDYLLKPLVMEVLNELLQSIRLQLDSNASITEREILLSGMNSPYSVNNLPSTMKNSQFGIFLICIGHLCSNITSPELTHFYLQIWSKIDWTSILPQDNFWWIIDEKQPNQKFIILSSDSPINNLNLLSLNLINRVTAKVQNLTVNICTNNVYIKYSDIWSTALELRLLLDKGLVMGKSAIIEPLSACINTLPLAILEASFQNKISILIDNRNKTSLQRELYLQFDKWICFNYPQRWIESVLNQLIKLFQRHSSMISEEEVFQMDYELKEKLTVSQDFKSMYGYIWDIFNNILSLSSLEKNDMKEFIINVENYIINNYASDMGIEDIARKFNINPTYLTKLFKKYLNETPSKYIIKLRISESENLLKSNPELDIKDISEIIGYTDQHYFSRLFKEIKGVSPSIFRELINKKN